MKGIFLGQGFALKEGTEIDYEEANGLIAIWNEEHTELLYILDKHFVKKIDEEMKSG